MLKVNRICGVILLIIAIASCLEGYRTWDGIGGTGLMPLIVGCIFLLLSLGFLTSKFREEYKSPMLWPNKLGWQRIGLVFMALVLYALLIPWLGYLIPTAFFLIMLRKIMGNVRWWNAVIFSGFVSASTYIIFKIWLNMALPTGLLGF